MPALDMGKYRERNAQGYHYKATENQKTDHVWGVDYEGEACDLQNSEMQEQATIRWENKYGKTREELAAESFTPKSELTTMTTGAKLRHHEQNYNKYDGTGAVFTAVGGLA
jgi:hypothetical protein